MEAAIALHTPVQLKAAIDAARPTAPLVLVVATDAAMRESIEVLIRSVGWPIQVFNSLQEFLISRAVHAERTVSKASALSAITASIAHEVNQPLSGVMTNACTCLRMLDATPPNIDAARETARRAIRDSARASDIVTRLHEMFSNRECALEPINLNDSVKEVIALSMDELQQMRVSVESRIDEDLPAVSGDPVQLQQVLLNLVRNASEAMNDVHDRPRQLLIKTDKESHDHVRVTVRDSGVGLSPSKSTESLFEAFHTTKRGGMGIGLFVSRSIIELHQGRIWAEPNKGAPGAAFAFSIPCVAAGRLDA